MKPVTETQHKRTRMWFTILICVGVFLLLAAGFFMVTNSMSSPTAMKLYLPKDSEQPEEQNKIKAPGALTLILDKNDVIYYYEGELAKDGSNMKKSDFKGIRQVIVKKKEATDEKDFVVVIKPSNAATYTNTVDILDEMTRNDVKRYAMVDISPVEASLISAK